MNARQAQRPNRTAYGLAALLVCFIAAAVFFGVTIGTIEHYMDITPVDWPYPGSFWDTANDLICGLILLPSGSIGRFGFWLVFFPVPILIELYRRNWRKAALFFLCVMLPYSYTDIMFENPLSNDSLSSILALLLFIAAPPYLINSWVSLCANPWERRLIRGNLIALWLLFCAADVLLGLNVHARYCKLSLIAPLSN
jgi:hypothetical protein